MGRVRIYQREEGRREKIERREEKKREGIREIDCD